MIDNYLSRTSSTLCIRYLVPSSLFLPPGCRRVILLISICIKIDNIRLLAGEYWGIDSAGRSCIQECPAKLVNCCGGTKSSSTKWYCQIVVRTSCSGVSFNISSCKCSTECPRRVVRTNFKARSAYCSVRYGAVSLLCSDAGPVILVCQVGAAGVVV